MGLRSTEGNEDQPPACHPERRPPEATGAEGSAVAFYREFSRDRGRRVPDPPRRRFPTGRTRRHHSRGPVKERVPSALRSKWRIPAHSPTFRYLSALVERIGDDALDENTKPTCEVFQSTPRAPLVVVGDLDSRERSLETADTSFPARARESLRRGGAPHVLPTCRRGRHCPAQPA